MYKFKTLTVVLLITFLMLAGFVNSSDAIEITDLSPTDGNYEVTRGWNQYLRHTETVVTDQPYSRVEWYVDDVLKETDTGDGVKTEAVFHPYFLIGSLTGTDYVIKAIAYPWEGEGSDTDSFTLNVNIFKIVKMEPNGWLTTDAYDYGSGAHHRVRLETSLPYYSVSWYIDDVFYSSNSFYGDPGTLAFLNLTDLTGTFEGKTYTIKARADYAWDTNCVDTDSYKVTVYKPDFTYDVDGKAEPDFPEVLGYSEITRYYRSGDDMILDCYVSAFYTEDADKTFKLVIELKNTIERVDEDTHDDTVFLDNENFYFPYSDTLTASFSSGETGVLYDCVAYVRIKVEREGVDGEDHYYRDKSFRVEK